jgi:hypothetical protein
MKFVISSDRKRLDSTTDPNVFVERCERSKEGVYSFRLNWEGRKIRFNVTKNDSKNADGKTNIGWVIVTVGAIGPNEAPYRFRDDEERRQATALAMDSLRDFSGYISIAGSRDENTARITVELSSWLAKRLQQGLH